MNGLMRPVRAISAARAESWKRSPGLARKQKLSRSPRGAIIVPELVKSACGARPSWNDGSVMSTPAPLYGSAPVLITDIVIGPGRTVSPPERTVIPGKSCVS